MHSVSTAISGSNPGDIRGHGAGLSTLFDNLARDGVLDCFCTFVAGSPGKTRGICKYYKYLLHFKIYSRNPSSLLPGNKNILSFPIPLE